MPAAAEAGLAGGRASGEAGAARRRKEGFPRPGSGGRPTSAPRARLPEPASFSAAAPPGRPRRARHPGKRPRLPPSAPYLSLRAAEPPRLRLPPPPPPPSGPLRARSGSEMARGAERDSGPSRRRRRRLPLPPQSPPQRSSPQPPRPPPAESSPERAMGPEGGRAQRGRPIDALGAPPRPRAQGAGGGGSTKGGREGAAAALRAEPSGSRDGPRAAASERAAKRRWLHADPRPPGSRFGSPAAPRGRASGRAQSRRGRTPAALLGSPPRGRLAGGSEVCTLLTRAGSL